MKIVIFLLLPILALAAEYEFLTPQTAVIKDKKFIAGASSFWKKENALLRSKNGRILRKPDITYFNYFIFDKPFVSGEKRNIGNITLQYNADKPSNIFKLNQAGFGASQKKKFAYIGAWLGKAGALPLKHLAGKEFELRCASNSECVYKNTLKLRPQDRLYQNTTPFTGEEVLELDFSSFTTPGKYYLHIGSVGRSMDFIIGPEAINEAFYIHARGLYHKRCGIAKNKPFTQWESPACHQKVFKGKFPENDADYRKGGFTDRKGNPIKVKHFDLIKENIPQARHAAEYSAPGGWHDAADYDRRPYHLRIVSDLAAVYLMKPENFIDGQLNIPESGNGIPDILDEAAWGLKHLLAVQQDNGGVGTWFETTGHPAPGEGMPDNEKRNYYISTPSRNGTLEYAAAASMLALAMQKAGADAGKYVDSAIKAWNFALNRKNQLIAWYKLNDRMVNYTENNYLYGENLLKAGVNLYILTGDKKFIAPVLKEGKRIYETFNKDFWKWSPFTWMTLFLHPVKELSALQSQYRKVILHNADKMVDEQENAYSYRTLWHAPDAGWVHAMSWGNYHPLRRAMTLAAAHKLTGDEKYLTGIYLANDFHNGANPLGRSMTSGLGKIYPAVFLDLISYAGNFQEFVPGITPYGNTFGLDRNAVKMVYEENTDKLPIFRRYVNLEFLSVPSSEYSVWETISPAAAVCGYLIEVPSLPSAELKKRKPAGDFRRLPGYRALP